MTKHLTVIACILCTLAGSSFGSSGEEITGLWNTEDGKAKVEVYHCGGHYCGKIVSLGEPLYPPDDSKGMGGRPRIDRENPDPQLRHRSLLGLRIMEGFEYAGNNTWRNGTVYDPESGKTYKGKVTLVSPRRLDLRGYVGIPVFGRTATWTR